MTINPVKSLVTTVLRRPSHSLARANGQSSGVEAPVVRRKQKNLYNPGDHLTNVRSKGSKAAGKRKRVT